MAPLAAAAGIVVVAAGTLIGAHLASSTGTHAATAGRHEPGPTTATGTAPRAPRPEFYLTVTYPASGQNVLQFQVRRTTGGAVTGSKTIPAGGVGWGGYLAASAGDRTFYFARYPCTTHAVPHTTFDRITITNSGQITGFAPAGPSVQGMVTAFAVSPGGSQVAYNALPGDCAGGGFMSPAAGSVSVEDLSTGAVRTWQDTMAQGAVGRLSWAPDGRTLDRRRSPARPPAPGPDGLRTGPVPQQWWFAAGPQHDPAAAEQQLLHLRRDGARGPGRPTDRTRVPGGRAADPRAGRQRPDEGRESSNGPVRRTERCAKQRRQQRGPLHRLIRAVAAAVARGRTQPARQRHSFRPAGSPVAACTRSPGSGRYSRKASPGKHGPWISRMAFPSPRRRKRHTAELNHAPAEAKPGSEPQSPTAVAADRIPISVSTAS